MRYERLPRGDCCFTGSLIALVVMVVNFIVANSPMLHWDIIFFCLTSIVLGIKAVIAIKMNPQALTDFYRSIFGIFLNSLKPNSLKRRIVAVSMRNFLFSGIAS